MDFSHQTIFREIKMLNANALSVSTVINSVFNNIYFYQMNIMIGSVYLIIAIEPVIKSGQ